MERIKAHSSAVYRKDSSPLKPLGFSYCCPHLHCADGAVRRHPHKETGGSGAVAEDRRGNDPLPGPWRFFLPPYRRPTCMEGGKKANDTHREWERILDTVGRCYQGEHTHTSTHTLSNSAFLTHISFSIFCGHWRRPPIVSIGRMCAAAVAVVRSSPGPPLIKATHAACECAPSRDDGHRHTRSPSFSLSFPLW